MNKNISEAILVIVISIILFFGFVAIKKVLETGSLGTTRIVWAALIYFAMMFFAIGVGVKFGVGPEEKVDETKKDETKQKKEEVKNETK